MRIARRLTHALIIVLTLVVGATAAAVVVTQTAWFKNWLRGYIVREANQYLNGTVSIERLGGNLFFGVELENIAVSVDGSQVVAVKDLGLDYNVFQLISGGLSIDHIRLNQPVLYLRHDGDAWSIGRLVKKQAQEADRSGPFRPISIDRIEVAAGSVVIDGPLGTSGIDVPKRFDHLDATLAFKYEPVRYSIEISHVSFRGSSPAIALNSLSGRVAVNGDTVYVEKLALQTAETSLSVDGAVEHYLSTPSFNLQIISDKLSVPEIGRVVPALAGVDLQPAFELKTSGTLDRLGVELNVRSSAGQLAGMLTADLMTPGQSVAGSVSVRHLNLAPILQDPRQKSDITGDVRLDVQSATFSDLDSLAGTLSLASPRSAIGHYVAEQVTADARIAGRQVTINSRASAYGASATATGRVTLPDGKTGEVAFDLQGRAQQLNLRRLPRQLNVPRAATSVSASYHVAGTPSSLSGKARFEPSTVAGTRIAAGSTAGFSLHGKNVGYHADLTVANLNLQTMGEQFNVTTLATDRYQSSINGHVIVDGSGTAPTQIDVEARGTLTETAILGGRISRMSFDAAMSEDTAHVKAVGDFSGFDPSVASGRSAMKGTVGGTLDIGATVVGVSQGVTPASVQATGTIDLQPSTIGEITIDRARVDADYHDSTGEIRALEIVGRDLNVTANGTLALNETGASNLKIHADSPKLDLIGKLVEQPIAGIGKIDATVTGNKRELRAAGTLTGDGVKYQENGALVVTSDYSVTLPDLNLAEMSATATTQATFVSIAGQNINELTAKTDYHKQQLDFDATAKQPQRSVQAAGSLLVRPDEQEVRLTSLGLQTAGVAWQLVPGSSPALKYGGGALAVDDLTLINGDQRVVAGGTFGRPGDGLTVTLTNVDVSNIDAVLMRPPLLSGRLNASARIDGTQDAPQVQADFAIEEGGVAGTQYDRFGGTIGYSEARVVFDTTLQQSATQSMQAKGSVPVALFTGAGSTSTEPIDLHIDSSPIDLGLAQGLTTEIANVTGTIELHVGVTGSAADPRPNGTISVQNAAFRVVSTGVQYTGLEGRIDLAPDRVHIDQTRLLDNQRKPLTITGDLAIHEGELGGVALDIKADDFKVVDSNIGNVRVNSNLQLAGQVSAPRIEGELGVATGSLELDQLLAAMSDSAYATTETEYAAASAAKPSAFDALQMDIHLTVPNDLVIRAKSLQTGGSPVGLGSLNLTVGGDLWVSKAPWDQVRLVGLVNTVRGSYEFQGRQFEILRDGSVRFDGLDRLDPTLDIRTQRIIQGVTAFVNIRGTLSKPEIVLSSTPPLEQADILSLIVFNQPINQLGEGQQVSLVQRAQALATGAVAGQLATSIGNALNLDLFEINTAPDSGATAQLTLGQQLGQNVYVKVQQGLGEQNQTNFILEYELTKWLRLQTNVVQGASSSPQLFQRTSGSGADLFFFFSY